jgi:nicotinate-nucleotide pyrophosphorylase (carboxylating)
MLPAVMIRPMIEAALREDLGIGGDLTVSTMIDEEATAEVVMAARKKGVIAGLEIARMVFETLDDSLVIESLVRDGDKVEAGAVLMRIKGRARAILMAERVALNFVGHMSGIATMTALMVAEVAGTKAKIVSTRKTLPNLRIIQKYALKMGGGFNHRLGLDDAVMLKDNHIAIAGSISKAVESVRAHVGHTVKIEVEIDRLDQLADALSSGAEIIMLDNMSLDDMAKAVKEIDGRAIVEASGNVRLETVGAIAKTGVDVISAGFLTHSVMNFDVGLDWVK